MTSQPQGTQHPDSLAGEDSVEMPRPTVAPLVLALGLALLIAGLPFGLGFLVVGGVILLTGAGMWVAHLLPGQGHAHEPLAGPGQRPGPIQGTPGGVAQLREGMPGYRFRLPLEVHPISAGIKGGLAGGLAMPIPALLWGLLTGHGLWYPINLLTGMVLPGVDSMAVPELERFHLSLLLVGVVIHAVMSVVLGLIYGVLLPTLPYVHRPIAWGGLLAPLLWTGTSYALMDFVNPVLEQAVSWPWFIVSQFVFGIAAAVVIMAAENRSPLLAGLLGGLGGGLLMPIPALLWSLLSGHGLWYPVNLLAGMVLRDLGQHPLENLEQFNTSWLVAALVVHALLSATFGILLAFIQKKLPRIPGPLAWGGLVLPLLWTGISYGLMGVANPVLQERVDWPWFVVSQFVFGVTAAVVVLRSEMVHIAPAGPGR
jgi:uncharacterized membrane protein YagU involved in acid resistance